MAVDVTSLFEFTGDVCYLIESDCPDDVDNPCFEKLLCCADIDGDGKFLVSTIQFFLMKCRNVRVVLL